MMTRTSLITAQLLLALSGLALVGCSDDDEADPVGRGLRLLFTSDEHSRMFAFSPELDDFPMATSPGDGSLVGGVARRATLFAQERDDRTLVVSAGDNNMGALPHITFESDGLDYQLMAALGYDMTTLGNHEFDFGPEATANAITAARAAGAIPPIVSSNIHFSDSDARDDALAALYSEDPTDDAPIHPYAVVTTASGIRVGFVGIVGANAAYVAPNKAPVRFSAPDDDTEQDQAATDALIAADVQPWVDQLRNVEQVDLVVALSHSGMNFPEGGDITEAEDYQLCANVVGIDVVISGHDHIADATPTTVTQSDGGECVVLNGGSYGRYVGRLDLDVRRHRNSPTTITWNPETQGMLAVDDTLVPDPDFATEVETAVDTIEAAGGSPSVLEQLISQVEEATVTNDTNTVGDLYFHLVGNTSFEVTDDSLLNYLSADAMLAASDAIGVHTDMGLESAGMVRNGIYPGQTGDISVADAFTVLPLGTSPLDGSIGYPLLRVHLSMLELRAVFEFVEAEGPSNSDFRMGQAGVRVELDRTRPVVEELVDLFDADKGRVMRIEVDRNHADGFDQYDTLLYDRATDFTADELVSVVTSTYIAQFAAAVGVSLKDENGEPITIPDAIMRRSDQSEIKELEAFMSFLKAAPGGTLSDIYDADSPSRTERQVCIAGC